MAKQPKNSTAEFTNTESEVNEMTDQTEIQDVEDFEVDEVPADLPTDESDSNSPEPEDSTETNSETTPDVSPAPVVELLDLNSIKSPSLRRAAAQLREIEADYIPMYTQYKSATEDVATQRDKWMADYAENSVDGNGGDEEYDKLRGQHNEFVARIKELQELEQAVWNAMKAHAAKQVGGEIDPEQVAMLALELQNMYDQHTTTYGQLKRGVETMSAAMPDQYEKDMDKYAGRIPNYKSGRTSKANSNSTGSGNKSAGRIRPKFELLLVKTSPDGTWSEVLEKVNDKPSRSSTALNMKLTKLVGGSLDLDDFNKAYFDAANGDLSVGMDSIGNEPVEFEVKGMTKGGDEFTVWIQATKLKK